MLVSVCENTWSSRLHLALHPWIKQLHKDLNNFMSILVCDPKDVCTNVHSQKLRLIHSFSTKVNWHAYKHISIIWLHFQNNFWYRKWQLLFSITFNIFKYSMKCQYGHFSKNTHLKVRILNVSPNRDIKAHWNILGRIWDRIKFQTK